MSLGDDSGGSRGGSRGAQEPLFGRHLALRSILVRQNGTPLFSYRTKKTAAMAHLIECFRRNSFKNRSIGLVGLVVGLKTIEMGVVYPESGRGF